MSPSRFIPSPPTPPIPSQRKAFTLLEILIVIVIIAQLAAILFPVFSRVRESARRSTCQSNLKQLGMGLLQYAQDYDDRTVPNIVSVDIYPEDATLDSTPWDVVLQPYLRSGQVLECPSDMTSLHAKAVYGDMSKIAGYSVDGTRSYSLPYYVGGISLSQVQRPSVTFNLLERTNIPYGRKYWSYSNDITSSGNIAALNDDHSGGGPKKEWRHLNTSNFLYMDGHVKALSKPSKERNNNSLPEHPTLEVDGNTRLQFPDTDLPR